MLLMHLFCVILFRLHIWQGDLSVSGGAVVGDHRVPLFVAVQNEKQDIRHLERNELGHFLLIMSHIVAPRLQLCTLLC